MTGTVTEAIPGIREAEDAFREAQLEAFTGVETPIAGFEVRPFSPRMFIELDGVGNDVVRAALAPNVADLAMFVWRISPRFRREGGWTRFRFLWKFRSVAYGPAVVEARDYLARAHAPRPFVSINRRESNAAWASEWVHIFGTVYGWTIDQTLDAPFRILWQQLNRILEEKDPKFRQKCPESIRLRAEWLKSQNPKKEG